MRGPQFGQVDPAERFAEHVRRSGRGERLGRRDAQQRRLACAVGAEHHPAFVEFHLPGHGSDEDVASTPHQNVFEFDEQIGIRLCHASILSYVRARHAAGSSLCRRPPRNPSRPPPCTTGRRSPSARQLSVRRYPVRRARPAQRPRPGVPRRRRTGTKQRIDLPDCTYGVWHGVRPRRRRGAAVRLPSARAAGIRATACAPIPTRSFSIRGHGRSRARWVTQPGCSPTTAARSTRCRPWTRSGTCRCRWSRPPTADAPQRPGMPWEDTVIYELHVGFVHRAPSAGTRRTCAAPTSDSATRR